MSDHRRRGAASFSQMKESSGCIIKAIKMYFGFFPKLTPIVFVCITVSAVTALMPAIFQKQIIGIIEDHFETGDWETAKPETIRLLIPLIVL